jgi:hypothetical protein
VLFAPETRKKLVKVVYNANVFGLCISHSEFLPAQKSFAVNPEMPICHAPQKKSCPVATKPIEESMVLSDR